jgi:hypothetical protein
MFILNYLRALLGKIPSPADSMTAIMDAIRTLARLIKKTVCAAISETPIEWHKRYVSDSA